MNITEARSILELGENPSLEDAKKSWRKLVFIWHPDKHQSNESARLIAEEKCKKINEAYDIMREAILNGSINQNRYKPEEKKPKLESKTKPKPKESRKMTKSEVIDYICRLVFYGGGAAISLPFALMSIAMFFAFPFGISELGWMFIPEMGIFALFSFILTGFFCECIKRCKKWYNTNKDTESSSKSEDKAWRWWGYRKGSYDRLLGISLFVLIIMGGAFTSCIENIEYFTITSIKEHLDLLPSALCISAFFVVIYIPYLLKR